MSEDQQKEFKEFTDRFTVKFQQDLNWENMLIQATNHFKNYQSFTVKSAHNNKKLRSWIGDQKLLHKRKKLRSDKQKKLEEIGLFD